MAEYKYTDVNEAHVALNLTISELKRLVSILEAVPEDSNDRYFAAGRAETFSIMINKAGEALVNWGDDLIKFNREDD